MKLNIRIKCTTFSDLSAEVPDELAFELINACGNEIPHTSPLAAPITVLFENADIDCAFYSIDVEEPSNE